VKPESGSRRIYGDHVFVRSIRVDGFMSFGQPVQLDLDAGLTVITGPNGAGKTNLGSCLDVVRALLAGHGTPESERLDRYEDAGFEGADGFEIRIGADLDQPYEKELVSRHLTCSLRSAA
jgi:recombinational DNA repair ATPase RecF